MAFCLENFMKCEIFDSDDALFRSNNDIELLRVLFETFLSLIPEYNQSLEQAVLQANFESIKKIAHTIKGSISNIGGHRAAQAASNLEQLANNRETSLIPKAVSDLFKEFQSFQSEFEKFSKSND